MREDRAREVASDVWEHERAGALEGRSRWRTAVSIASRAFRGVPQDVVWSTEALLDHSAGTVRSRVRGAYQVLAVGYLAFGVVVAHLDALGWVATVPLALFPTTAIAVSCMLGGGGLVVRLPRAGALLGAPGLLWLLDIVQYLWAGAVG